MTKWTPPTYADAYPDTPDGQRVHAACCGRSVWPWILQDMRGIPGVSHDWMCDGCRSHLHRHKIAVDGGESPATRAEWRTRLMKAHGAPETAVKASEAMHGTRPH